ncbi:MAG: NTP transferase domain-containing protein [Phycisphaerae bacterium]
MANSAAIILAAGKSTRMAGDKPKVLHEVCGRSMLACVLDACAEAGVERIVVVVGCGKDAVIDACADREGITWVEQVEQKGTGHAALVCEEVLGRFDGQTIVLAGDMPLVRSETLSGLLADNAASGDAVTLATSIFEDPSGYGRIARDGAGRFTGIVEEADCTDRQRAIREVNISYYCFDNRRMFEALHAITPDNSQGEYYITDAVRILLEKGYGAGARATVAPADAMGVNSSADLEVVNTLMLERRFHDHRV